VAAVQQQGVAAAGEANHTKMFFVLLRFPTCLHPRNAQNVEHQLSHPSRNRCRQTHRSLFGLDNRTPHFGQRQGLETDRARRVETVIFLSSSGGRLWFASSLFVRLPLRFGFLFLPLVELFHVILLFVDMIRDAVLMERVVACRNGALADVDDILSTRSTYAAVSKAGGASVNGQLPSRGSDVQHLRNNVLHRPEWNDWGQSSYKFKNRQQLLLLALLHCHN
jgi:hypothetical protein